MQGSLTLVRARVRGTASSGDLAQALAGVGTRVSLLDDGEILFVPHLRTKAVLRGTASSNGFAECVALELMALAAQAARDPLTTTPVGPIRFSTYTAFAAWLIGAVLDRPMAAAQILVRAATGQTSPQHWWRRDILPSGRVVVAVLARLAQAGLAVPWVIRLAPEDVAVARQAVVRDFGLTQGSAITVEKPSRSQRQEAVSVLRQLQRAGNAVEALPGEAATLLILAVMLSRHPATRRAGMIAAVETALAAMRDNGLRRAAPAAEADGFAPETPNALPPQPIPIGRKSGRDRPDIAYPPALPRSGEAEGRSPIPLSVPEPLAPLSDAATRPNRDAQPDSEGGSVRMDDPPEAPVPEGTRPAQTSPVPDDATAPLLAPLHQFETRYGGLAFLLNALTELGLYPDFTRPLDPALSIAPLAVIDRLGCHWFGTAYRADGLHAWITARGDQGRLPPRWRAQAGWLRPFTEAHATHSGTTLWHEAGFPLATGVQPHSARRAARDFGLRLRPDTRKRQDPRWIACLALYLEARLKRAVAGGALCPRDLILPARAAIGVEALTLHFALDQLPIAVRLAGLDRNPGWVPAEGRDIRFVFA